MSILSQQKDGATIIAENTDVYLEWDFGNTSQGRVIASALQIIHSLPPVREKKILEIREQLAEGTYDIDGRLDVVLDCLFEELIG